MPTDNDVALPGIVPMNIEAAGLELEFDPQLLFDIAKPAVSYAVGKLRTDRLDTELKPACYMGEKEHDAQFIHGGVLHWCVLQRKRFVFLLHLPCPNAYRIHRHEIPPAGI